MCVGCNMRLFCSSVCPWFVVENSGRGDCFWIAHEQLSGIPFLHARQWVSEWARTHEHIASNEATLIATPGTATTENHVDAAVQAFPGCHVGGMLVFHEPAGCAVQFRTNAGPDVLNWGEGMCALKAHQGHAMLYTEPFGPCHVGHFEALVQICPQDVLRACGAHSPPRPESDILPTMSGGVNSRVKQETASPSQKRRRVLKTSETSITASGMRTGTG